MSVNYSKLMDRSLKTLNYASFFEYKKEEGKKLYPSITVSRDPGSGGRPIAKMVADSLGFEFYNSKLMNEIAKSSKRRSDVISQVDEKARTKMQDLVHSIVNPDYISEQTYISHLCKTILGISYNEGKSVFLGRGSNFVIPPDYVLRVRITAPYRIRVMRAVEYEQVSYERAREIIREVTQERQDFVKQYFSKNIKSASHYDIVINTKFYTLKQARDVILSAYKQKFPRGVVSL